MASVSFRALLSLAFLVVLFSVDSDAATSHRRAQRDARKKKKKPEPEPESKWSDEETYFNFASRPDIQPVRWEIEYTDKSARSDGYWFVSPYANLEQTEFSSWNGPHIYDQDGELVWSGVKMFNHLNIYDFRLAQVDGRMVPTLIFTEHADGIILDEGYNINQTVDMFGMDLPQWLLDQIGHQHTTNMHDFNVIEDGKRAVMLTKIYENATLEESQEVGFAGECTAKWQGFKEVDVATSEILFDWNSHGRIQLQESTYKKGPIDEMCNGNAGPGGWDILHLNSVDKFPDGDYLVSSRHTNTLYKVSHKDKSIIWRLKADHGDFKWLDGDAKFSRQHHARVYSQNDTHTLITVFNNARGTGGHEESLGDSSSGLLIALREDQMTAELVGRYVRPDGKYTAARGSMQILDNGNAFVGWSKHSFQSEHTPDGRMIMQARLRREGANTYRAYKYPWVGRPTAPPDVYSVALASSKGQVDTMVYVSWNGDTEVKTWNLYKTNPNGEYKQLVGSTVRHGFESMLSYEGYASYVLLEGVDANGQVIGRSRLIETLPPNDLVSPAVAQEAQWLQAHSGSGVVPLWLSLTDNPIVTYFLGVVSCAVTMLVVAFLWWTKRIGRFWMPRGSYHKVGEKEVDEFDFDESTVVEEMSERTTPTKGDV